MRALAKLSWVELKLFARDPVTVIFSLAFPVITFFVLAGVFGNEPEFDNGEPVWRGVGPTDYYVAAYIGLVMASIGLIALPVHLAAYREQGVLRRLRASSISLWAVLGSQVVFAVVMATIGGILITIAATLSYGTQLPDAPGQLVVAFALSALCFSAIGVLLGSVLATTRAAQGGGLILFFVMFMISGTGPPREVMSGAMQLLGDLTPLRYVIFILQDPWLGFGWDGTTYLIVAAITVLASLISLRAFQWE
jgi:ABC-2 type transport system permease protein